MEVGLQLRIILYFIHSNGLNMFRIEVQHRILTDVTRTVCRTATVYTSQMIHHRGASLGKQHMADMFYLLAV